MKQILCYFRYGRGKQKENNTYAEKIAFVRYALSTQFFRHVIDKGFYRFSPLDSRLLRSLTLDYAIGRLAAALPVMIDSPLTAIADGQPSDAKAAFMRRYNKFPLARRPKGGIALVGSCTAAELKNGRAKRFL